MMLSLTLFAGGDLLTVEPISKYEKMEYAFNNYVDNADIENSFKPTVVDNCVTTCGEAATLLPYYGEDIPIALTMLCFAEDSMF